MFLGIFLGVDTIGGTTPPAPSNEISSKLGPGYLPDFQLPTDIGACRGGVKFHGLF